MDETISFINFLLAVGGLVFAFGTFVLFFDIYSKNFSLKPLVCTYGLFCAWLLSFVSSVMTLVYSEVFGFVPCGLCWLQRVCLYPQVLLLAVALYSRDKTVAKYGIVLSIPGVVISLYQHYLQMGGMEFVTCPKTGADADCATRILFEFGFMTFPLISTFLFTFLIGIYVYIATCNKTV